MKISIKIISILFIASIISSCNTNSSPDYISEAYEESRPLTEEELKQQLLNKECNNADDYLDGNLKYTPVYKNVLSMKVKGLKLTCNIKNNATLATLKDIKASVRFESKTGATILEKNFDIYEFIAPNKSYKYKTEITITNQQFKDISSFKWTILDAKCK